MPRKAAVKYRSLRSNLVHLPLSLYASLAQSQTRPQGLILHLAPLVPASTSRRAPQSAYLGWSGLAAASSLSGGIGGSQLETIEVDPEVALNYGWAEGTILEISIIHNPTKARSVTVTPLTTDDWEILEQNANYLENNLLGQLRAAQKGQEIDVWVMGRTKIRIRVDATNPPTSSSSVVLVNADTEIYVAPRPRNAAGSGSAAPASEAPKVVNTAAVAATATAATGKGKGPAVKEATVRLVPPRVAARWGFPVLSHDDAQTAGNDKVAWCSPPTLRKLRRRFGLGPEVDPVFVNLRRVQESTEDDEDSSSGDRKEPPKAEQPTEGTQQGGDAEAEEPPLQAWIVGWDEMPAGCVVLSGELEAEWSPWLEAKVSLATPKASSRPKANGTAPVHLLSIPSSPDPPLAGVGKLLESAINYFTRAALSGHAKPLLITGSKGSGKTAIAKAIGGFLEADRSVLAEVIYNDVGRMDPDSRVKQIKEEMSKWIEDAQRRAPCILILDNLDLLLSPENENTVSSNPAILAEHFARLFSAKSLPPGVVVLATATGSASLHGLMTSKHIFGESMKVMPPRNDTRREILEVLVKSQEQAPSDMRNVKVSEASELDYVTLATLSEGYSASDLNDLVTGANQQVMIRCMRDNGENTHLTMDDFVAAQEAFTPFSLRGVSLQKSDVRWEDIGGLHEARLTLRETLEWPTKYARIFAHSPLRLRSGLLLYGYPGCGKTLLASAVARECGLNFISVKGPEILNKYIGQSEQSVRDLFERASAAKPCVLFFDEFDSIAPKRGHDSTGVTDRVVNQMLTEMDGAQGLDGVYVLAATSRPDLIDPALLRPGRLDKSILCDMPGVKDRLEIIQSFTKKLHVVPGIDFEQLAFDTEGFSGADLQALVYNAHLDVVHSVLNKNDVEEKRDEEVSGKGKDKAVDKGKGKAVVDNGKGKGKGKAVENGDSDGGEDQPTENGADSPSTAVVAATPAGHKRVYHQLQPAETTITSAVRNAFNERIETIVSTTAPHAAEGDDAGQDKAADPLATPTIEERHLRESMKSTRPSVTPAERARFGKIYQSFVQDRDGNLSNGDLGRATGTRSSLK